MSVGGLLGAVAGGVIGFFIGGGPAGVLYGASIGFALGMAIDPMTPDMPSPGTPDPMGQVMSGEIGEPIPDLAGTAKITGHLLCYGKERSEAVYSTSSGGGGKGGPPEPQPQVTGYRYFMSWALGVVAGPVTTLYAIYKNEDVVWEGELNCPVSGGQETVVLEGMGSATFYFGTTDHSANSKVGEIIGDASLNSPYRNLCWCFFDDCFIGEYNRTPTMKFMLKKIPEYSFSTKHGVQVYDCNPAHVMWFVLHNLTGLPETWLHSADFAAAATVLWGEDKGLSVLFDRQQNALNYLESVNVHVENILRYGTDGKFHPKLIRDDYVIGDLPLIDEDVMLEEPTFNRKSWIDTINEMKVQYSELIDADRCVDDLDMAFDYETSAETVAKEDSVIVAVTGLNTPFAWEVSGTGFSLEHEITKGLTNTLHADNTACGPATITVIGCDDTEITGYVRCTTGSWVLQSWDCKIPGPWTSKIATYEFERVEGKYKINQVLQLAVGFNNVTCIPITDCSGYGDVENCIVWECPDIFSNWLDRFHYYCIHSPTGCNGGCFKNLHKRLYLWTC